MDSKSTHSIILIIFPSQTPITIILQRRLLWQSWCPLLELRSLFQNWSSLSSLLLLWTRKLLFWIEGLIFLDWAGINGVYILLFAY